MGQLKTNFFLEECDNGGIIVEVPCIDQDENNNEYIKHFKVKVEEGKKADVVRQFFIERSTAIVRDFICYNIFDILFDECELPKYIKRDIIY